MAWNTSDNLNETMYLMNATNQSFTMWDYENTTSVLIDHQWEEHYRLQYRIVHIFIPILMLFALVAMVVNTAVFSSVHWIRRPMPPILKISLSLAAADGVSSSVFAATLFINTYLPSIGFNGYKWLQIVMEMVKLSGILITVIHLLALSLNHYIGILKPLHYNSIVTRPRLNCVLLILWVVPSVFILGLFTLMADDGYWWDAFDLLLLTEDNATTTFVDTFRFRMSYSVVFFIAIALMAICYTHIVFIVRAQKKLWLTLQRSGSKKSRGQPRGRTAIPDHQRQQQKRLENDLKAIYTTLLILGSCVIGWMPALLIFILLCKVDCLINGDQLDYINETYLIEVMSLRLFENLLVILKMLVNPIIYSIRMKEIQDAMHQMRNSILRRVCSSRTTSELPTTSLIHNDNNMLLMIRTPSTSSKRHAHYETDYTNQTTLALTTLTNHQPPPITNDVGYKSTFV